MKILQFQYLQVEPEPKEQIIVQFQISLVLQETQLVRYPLHQKMTQHMKETKKVLSLYQEFQEVMLLIVALKQ